MTDYKCICGNKTNNMCSLKCCKNCCNSMYCLEHNPTDILKCDKTMCFICGDTKYSNDFIALCNNLYYCNSCSINNREIFDRNNKIYVSNIQPNCICGNPYARLCLLKGCGKCCKALGCKRHQTSVKQLTEDTCIMCLKRKPQLNSYCDEGTDNVIRYCDDCYYKNKKSLDNMHTNKLQCCRKNNMILGCEISTIKRIMSNKVNNVSRSIGNLHELYFETFLKKYKDIPISYGTFYFEIINHKYYDFDDLHGYNYECPICEGIDDFTETNFCDKCDMLTCDMDCHVHDDDGISYCMNCYDDRNSKFFEKYKNMTLTKDIISQNDFILDLDEIEELEYNFNYECPNCNVSVSYNGDDVMKCDRCNNYVCNDCAEETYGGCSYYDCYYCMRGICYNNRRVIKCNSCYPNIRSSEIKKSISRPVSPCIETDDIDKQCNVCMINVKNYACIPCGHLCICGECSNKIDEKCPICNNKIMMTVRIF